MTKSVSPTSPMRVVGGIEGAPQADLRLRDEERLGHFGAHAGLARDGSDLGDRSGQGRQGAPDEDSRAKVFRDRLDASLRKSGRHMPPGEKKPSEQDDMAALDERAGRFGLPGPGAPALPPGPASDAEDRHGAPGKPDAAEAATRLAAQDGDENHSETAAAVTVAETAGEPRRMRVLAVAEPPPDSLASLFMPGRPACPAGEAVDPAGEAPRAGVAVERVAARVEEAIRAELTAGRGAPIEIRIPVDPGIDGLQSLSVEISASGIDIVIARGAGAPSEGLVQAAQALADRLQRRSGKACVRVLDLVGRGGHRDEQAPDAPAAQGREHA